MEITGEEASRGGREGEVSSLQGGVKGTPESPVGASKTSGSGRITKTTELIKREKERDWEREREREREILALSDARSTMENVSIGCPVPGWPSLVARLCTQPPSSLGEEYNSTILSRWKDRERRRDRAAGRGETGSGSRWMPNYYIVKYLLENWIIHSLFLSEQETSHRWRWLNAAGGGWKTKKSKPNGGRGEGEGRDSGRMKAGRGGPVSHRKKPWTKSKGVGGRRRWVAHASRCVVDNGLYVAETKPQKTPVNGAASMRKPRRNDTRARANWALEVTPPRGMLSSTLGTILSLSRRSSDDLFLRPSLSLSLSLTSGARAVSSRNCPTRSFVRGRRGFSVVWKMPGGRVGGWKVGRRGVGCTRKKADRGEGRRMKRKENEWERERERERSH